VRDVSLRIHIDEEHPLRPIRQSDSEVHRCRRLSHTTLHIDYGDAKH